MDLSNERWRKSSLSGNGGDCVEVGQAKDGTIMVRDTKLGADGPVHRYTPAEWTAFLGGVANGEFALDESGRLV